MQWEHNDPKRNGQALPDLVEDAEDKLDKFQSGGRRNAIRMKKRKRAKFLNCQTFIYQINHLQIMPCLHNFNRFNGEIFR